MKETITEIDKITKNEEDPSSASPSRRDFLKTAGAVAPLALLGDVWRPRQAWAQAPENIQYGTKLKASISGSPLTFDPNYMELYEELATGSMIYNRLVRLEPDMSAHPGARALLGAERRCQCVDVQAPPGSQVPQWPGVHR